MVIGIDIRVLSAKLRGGIQEYTENLLAHLLLLDKSIQYRLFYSSLSRELSEYPWLNLPNVKLFKKKIPNRALFLTSHLFNSPKLDQLVGGADVFFFPHFLLGSLSVTCRRVTTFHDLSFVHFPEFFSLWRKLWHFQMRPYWQAKFSDRIIAVSDFTKKDVSQTYDIDEAKIETIYSGFDPSFKPFDDEAKEKFRKDNKLPEKFILSLATLEPRKNIAGTIGAFEKIKEAHRDIALVIVGSKGWLHSEMDVMIEKSKYKKDIHLVGEIMADRAGYYNCAEMLVYPSFFEGFGLPPLEAMACGISVVASHASSLPEVVGDAGILINPYNITDIARGISIILENKGLADRLREKSLARASQFSWQKAADKTLEVLVK